jgi:hypothetical protein
MMMSPIINPWNVSGRIPFLDFITLAIVIIQGLRLVSAAWVCSRFLGTLGVTRTAFPRGIAELQKKHWLDCSRRAGRAKTLSMALFWVTICVIPDSICLGVVREGMASSVLTMDQILLAVATRQARFLSIQIGLVLSLYVLATALTHVLGRQRLALSDGELDK